jgi:hypothetical protein
VICNRPGCKEHTRWWDRPKMFHCGRGFDFHEMGLAHGENSQYAKSLKEKAADPKKGTSR